MSATSILVGYFPKRSTVPDGWAGSCPVVTELCSVSECLAAGPPNWIAAWRHNALGLFDNPEIARGLVPPAEREAFHIFAYRILPWRWVGGRPESYLPRSVDPAPLPPPFERLGYDVVTSSTGSGFECSPLSCNGLAATFPVNRYCLFETEAEARELAERVEAVGAEPGPYYVVEVLRQRPEQDAPDRGDS